MTIDELITICEPTARSGQQPERLGTLHQDSRRIEQGDLFIAVRGIQSDGHDFIDEAVSNGASTIITEKPVTITDPNVFCLQVPSTRLLVGPLAQAFHGHPADRMAMIGVTGTNGKTTVTTLVWQLLQQMGVKSGLLGTVLKQIGDEPLESRLTTSDPIELADDLRKMADAGCQTVAMEVSSHALDQERTRGVHWKVGAFTNLSHDHLDYHNSMDSYAAAKQKLFRSLDPSASAVINSDDPYAKTIRDGCQAAVIDFSFQEEATVQCQMLESGPDGLRILVDDVEIQSPLAGRFNAYNVAEAWLISRELGYDASELARLMKYCSGAPGRMEKVSAGSNEVPTPTVFVDYAHTPDALQNVASTLYELKKPGQPLVILFGCGGDRDRAKRPAMAKAAEQWGDQLVITSDNPRSEDPEKIIREIEAGITGDKNRISLPDREEAIFHAILTAPENAIILIAGKGHETWQEVDGKQHPFDDRDIARKALEAYSLDMKTGRTD